MSLPPPPRLFNGPEATDQDAGDRPGLPLRRLDQLTHMAGIGYWTLSARNATPVWSDALRTLIGWAPDAPPPAATEWLRLFVHPQDLRRVTSAVVAWLKARPASTAPPGSQLDIEFRLVRTDGAVRHVITHSRIERRGPHMLRSGVLQDVTEPRTAARQLLLERERSALAARSAGIGTWDAEMDTGVVHWDDMMWTLRGRKAPGRPPTSEERTACLHPDDRQRVLDINRQLLSAEGSTEFEFRVVWPDGTVRWLAHRSIVRGEPGTPRVRFGANWDVTDRRSMEQTRREHELVQRESRAKSQFLSRMSHELRTPLNAVLGFSQLLLEQPSDPADPAATQRRQWVQHIQGAGQHLLVLINDVLDLARVEGGEMAIELQTVSLQAVVHAALPLVQPQADARRIHIECGALQACARADPRRLRQVVLNLLSNAIKYNHPGGHVRVEAFERDDATLLRVIDSGRGIGAEQLAHLFEPFNRLGADHEAIEGTGIGLAYSKALVEHMGGMIGVSSVLGQGSVFEVWLRGAAAHEEGASPPATSVQIDSAAASAHAGAAAAPSASTPGGAPSASSEDSAPSATAVPARRRVLYIEDNPVNALIVQEALAREPGLQLALAATGQEGLDKAREWQPHLVLLDMQLPDLDGFEVLRRLKAAALTAATPVVALSANAMPDQIERARAAGVLDYWTKPLNLATFVPDVRELLKA